MEPMNVNLAFGRAYAEDGLVGTGRLLASRGIVDRFSRSGPDWEARCFGLAEGLVGHHQGAAWTGASCAGTETKDAEGDDNDR